MPDFIWSLLLIYFWTILLLTLLSVSLACFGATLNIRKTCVHALIWLFTYISENVKSSEKKVCDSDVEDEAIERRANPESFVILKDTSKWIFRRLSEMPTQRQTLTILDDSLNFIKAGMETVIEDDVTCRFNQAQLHAWNLLTRTSAGHSYNSVLITFLWLAGFLLRYFVLFPIRIIIFYIGLFLLITSTWLIGCISDKNENMAKPGGICVANHTSIMDVQVLSMDNCYALVGQRHPGFLGLLQRCLDRASKQVWFERSVADDRLGVKKRLKEHVEDGHNMPILIFPEGTCINNTSLMMFKKGSFEIEGALIYPVALKYDLQLGDAFWNSAMESYPRYLLKLMTSWATVVDVFYLPPMLKESDEDGMKFAARVKSAIAKAGGFLELEWDGQLKRYPVKKEALEKQRERMGRRVIRAQN